jgi:hypothetical protein
MKWLNINNKACNAFKKNLTQYNPEGVESESINVFWG